MAIAFDTSTDGGLANPGNTLDWSHTCTGTGLGLLVAVRSRLGASDQISAVSYNGVSLTKVGAVAGDSTSKRWLSFWFLEAPDTGSHTVHVDGGATSDVIMAMALSLTGLPASGNPEVETHTDTTDTLISQNITTITDNAWVGVMVGNGSGAVSTTTGWTARQNTANGLAIGDTNGPVSPAGVTNFQATIGSSNAIGIILVSIAPAGGGGGGDLVMGQEIM